MISVAAELIDRITAAFHYLRVGKAAAPIDIPEDLPDNEIRQLMTYVNRFLVEFTAFSEALAQMAQGELHTRAVASRMAVVQSLKSLQSNLTAPRPGRRSRWRPGIWSKKSISWAISPPPSTV